MARLKWEAEGRLEVLFASGEWLPLALTTLSKKGPDNKHPGLFHAYYMGLGRRDSNPNLLIQSQLSYR